MYIYIYIYTCAYTYKDIYIYIERERESQVLRPAVSLATAFGNPGPPTNRTSEVRRKSHGNRQKTNEAGVDD